MIINNIKGERPPVTREAFPTRPASPTSCKRRYRYWPCECNKMGQCAHICTELLHLHRRWTREL